MIGWVAGLVAGVTSMVCAVGLGVSLSPLPTPIVTSPADAAAWSAGECFYSALAAEVPAGLAPAANNTGCSLAGTPAGALGVDIQNWTPPARYETLSKELSKFAGDVAAQRSPQQIAIDASAAYGTLSQLAATSGPIPEPAGSPTQMAALAAAESQLGVPYLWGGTGNGGFDCSGLTQWAYAQVGVPLPRVAQAQFDAGPLVPAGTSLVAGDLVFFHVPSDGPGVGHVGIYVGNDYMLDAPYTGQVIRFDRFDPQIGVDAGGMIYVGATSPAGAT